MPERNDNNLTPPPLTQELETFSDLVDILYESALDSQLIGPSSPEDTSVELTGKSPSEADKASE